MPHAHSLYINTIKEHLADFAGHKKLNFDPTQAIKHDILSTLDSVHSTYCVDHRTRNLLTPQVPSCTPILHGLPKLYMPYLPPTVAFT